MAGNTKFQNAIEAIDAFNHQDPNKELEGGKEVSKEWLYAQRMSETLSRFYPQASETLRLAARAQHIGRWQIPRSQYSMDRPGYLRWRNSLKDHHAILAAEILNQLDFEDQIIERVKFLIRKESLKKDAETQVLEDVICLVFLQHYASDFVKTKDESKAVAILKKTWRKMSVRGRETALKLKLDEKLLTLVKQAI